MGTDETGHLVLLGRYLKGSSVRTLGGSTRLCWMALSSLRRKIEQIVRRRSSGYRNVTEATLESLLLGHKAPLWLRKPFWTPHQPRQS